MRNNTVFADAFNSSVFNGEQVIIPERLHPADSTLTALPYKDVHLAAVQKYRDLIKHAVIMQDDNAAYLLLGIENQSDVHYAMPVRNMLYDALQYTEQVLKAAQTHREEAKARKEQKQADNGNAVSFGSFSEEPKLSTAEFLSGFHRTDRLIPVITLVVLFSAEPWDGPLSIHDMLSTQDKGILSLIPDYRIHLISPALMEQEDFDRFHTGLREILLYIKYSKDKEVLQHILSTDTRFQALERDAAVVINTLTGSRLSLDKKLEVTDMCKAIDDIREDARSEGLQEGRLQMIKNAMINLNWTLEYAMNILGIPVSERAVLVEKLNQ